MIMKKFKKEIPYCYDDLFIKKQMLRLAQNMKKNDFKNEIIDYWAEIKL